MADALSRFVYPASKAFQDTSTHGSEAARQEVKKIIADELAEARTVALIFCDPEGGDHSLSKPPSRFMLIGGTVSRWKELPAKKIRVVTRGGLNDQHEVGDISESSTSRLPPSHNHP